MPEFVLPESDWPEMPEEHRGFLARAPQAQARQSRRATRVSLGCITRTAAGDRRALPLRAILAPDETVIAGEAMERVPEARRQLERQRTEYIRRRFNDWIHID